MSRCLLVVALAVAAALPADGDLLHITFEWRCLETRHLVGGYIEYTMQNCSGSAICHQHPCGCMVSRHEDRDNRTEYACDYQTDRRSIVPDSCHFRLHDDETDSWQVRQLGNDMGASGCIWSGDPGHRVWRCCCAGRWCNVSYRDNGTLEALIDAATPAPDTIDA